MTTGDEINVRLELRASEQFKPEDLEEVTLDVLQAVEEHASELAFGAVASTDLDERTITLVFQIDASGDVFATLQKIVDVIESEGGVPVRLRRAAVEDRPLVSA